MAVQLTDETSIDKVIREMTLEEKLLLLTGSTEWRGGKNDRHGIPAPLFLDGGTGFNSNQMMLETLFDGYEKVHGKCDRESMSGPLDSFGVSVTLRAKIAHPETMDEETKEIRKVAEKEFKKMVPQGKNFGCFPPGSLLAATMNPKAVRDCGEAVGREASACHIDVLLGTPNVNLMRDPRNGRFFEGYSEDPCVASTLAPEFVKGVQSTGVAANVKHFAANNQETDRMGLNEEIDERTLRELYLPGFEACVRAGCKTVMSAYNRINGTACSENSWLLEQVLRKEWGFDGFVMSDWGAVYRRPEGLKNGNDVVMPGPREIGSLQKAVEEGFLTEERVDEACRRYLHVLLDLPIMKGRKFTEIDETFSMEKAVATAREGITLLKNNGVLPLAVDTKVAFLGEKSRRFMECGTGSAGVKTDATTSFFGIAQKIAGERNVCFGEVPDDARAVVVTVGAGSGEGADRPDLEMDSADRELLEGAIRKAKALCVPVVLVLNITSPVELTDYLDDVDAVLNVYLPGMGGGRAAAEILYGKCNPSGKLPYTYPKHVYDLPAYLNFPGEYQNVRYGEGIYVGYRYYDKKHIAPLFPFGYGLSYTTFSLSDLKADREFRTADDETRVSVKIKNTGETDGAEVVQLYLSDLVSSLERPVRELKGFHKVFLRAGEEATISFVLKSEDFAFYDTRLEDFVTEPGDFCLTVEATNCPEKQSCIMNVVCRNPYLLSAKTAIASIVADPRAMEILDRKLTGIDFRAEANMYIVFLPFRTFEFVWNDSIRPKMKDMSEEEKDALYQSVLAEFEALQ